MDAITIVTPSPTNNCEDNRRFNRSLRLLQRNKVDTAKHARASHRFSMPVPRTKATDDDQKGVQYFPILGKKESKTQIGTVTGSQATEVHIHGILAQASSSDQSSLSGTMSPYLASPRLSSWIPGLFYFKQPKVLCLVAV
jgi:hypothetical protein